MTYIFIHSTDTLYYTSHHTYSQGLWSEKKYICKEKLSINIKFYPVVDVNIFYYGIY